MRVRTGRFDGLRSRGEPGHPQFVEEAVRQRDVEVQRRVMPPPSAVACNPTGGVITHPASTKLAINGRTSLPMLELQRRRRWRTHLSVSAKTRGVSAIRKEAFHPNKYSPNSLHTAAKLFPTTRRVSVRTRSFTRFQVSDATRSLTFRPGATQNEKPRNFRSVARATALLASLMRSFSRA